MKELMENWRDYEKEIISEAAVAAGMGVLAPGAVEAALGAMATETGAVVSGAGSVASGVVAPVLVGTAVGAGAGIEAIHQVTGIPRRGILDRAIIGAMAITDLISGGSSAQEYHKAVTQDAIRNAVKPALAMAATAVAPAIASSPMSEADYIEAMEEVGRSSHDIVARNAARLNPYAPTPTPEPPKKPMSTLKKVGLGLGGAALLGKGGKMLYDKVTADSEREENLDAAGLSDTEVQADLEDVVTGGGGDGTSGKNVAGTDDKKAIEQDTEERVKTLRTIKKTNEVKKIVREEVIKFLSNRRKK